MLIRYKKSQEKIAMGLLSFMPDNNDVKSLQQLIKQYENDDTWHLYFWREEEDIIGLIGLRVEEGRRAIVQHLSVNPSFRNSGIGRTMVNEVRKLYAEEYEVCGDEATESFLRKCCEDETDAS